MGDSADAPEERDEVEDTRIYVRPGVAVLEHGKRRIVNTNVTAEIR